MSEEVKNTKNPVILITAATSPGKRSPQTRQSELYARAMEVCGGIGLLDGGFGDAEALAERADGLLLSGGGDIHPSYYGRTRTGRDWDVDERRDAREMALLHAFCARKKPVLGICRGIQVIDVYFGGTLFHQLGTAHLHDCVNHQVVTAQEGGLRPLFGSHVVVNSYHHQAIRTLGRDLRVTAVNEADGVIEGVEHTALPVFAVQWHAERMLGGICQDGKVDMKPLFDAFFAKIR